MWDQSLYGISQGGDHLVDDLIRELTHFRVGSVLYRVLHEAAAGFQPESLALNGGGFLELA